MSHVLKLIFGTGYVPEPEPEPMPPVATDAPDMPRHDYDPVDGIIQNLEEKFDSFDDLKAYIRANFHKGFPDLLGRSGMAGASTQNFSFGKARILYWLLMAGGINLNWVPVTDSAPTWMWKGKQVSLLAYWGLIETRPTAVGRELRERGEDEKSKGTWRVTQKGFKFAQGLISISKTVSYYDKKFLRYIGKPVTMKSTFGRYIRASEIPTEGRALTDEEMPAKKSRR